MSELSQTLDTKICKKCGCECNCGDNCKCKEKDCECKKKDVKFDPDFSVTVH